jgi:hypothetical protein
MDDIEQPVVITAVVSNGNKLKNNISVIIWVMLAIGILIGICVYGFVNQLSNMVDLMTFIETNVTWRIWLILITILSILFLILDLRFRTRIEV